MPTETKKYLKKVQGDLYTVFEEDDRGGYRIYEQKVLIDKEENLYQVTRYDNNDKTTVIQLNGNLPILENVFINGRLMSTMSCGYDRIQSLSNRKHIIYENGCDSDKYKTIFESFEGCALDDDERYAKIEIINICGEPIGINKKVEETRTDGKNKFLTEVFIDDEEQPSSFINFEDEVNEYEHPVHDTLKRRCKRYTNSCDFPYKEKIECNTYKDSRLVEFFKKVTVPIRINNDSLIIKINLIELLSRVYEHDDQKRVIKIVETESITGPKSEGIETYRLSEQGAETDTFVKIVEIVYE